MNSIANGVFGFLQRRRVARHAKEAILVAANLDAPPMYREGDWLGAALAYVSLMPAFHVFWRGALLYHERSWDQLEEFLGVGGNAVLSKLLKRLVKVERPAATCEALGLCGDLGMPSTHSQIMAFAWASMVLQVPTRVRCPAQTDGHEGAQAPDNVFRVAASVPCRLQMRAGQHRRHPGGSTLDALEFLVLTTCVAAVAWSRIYLGYHDSSQVCAGAAPEELALLGTCWHGWNAEYLQCWYGSGLATGVATAVVWRWAADCGWIRGTLQRVFQYLSGARHQHVE